ncbi:MAG: UDP-galactopyranose mutase [Candidatus Izemoplasmatales bacterium]
MVSVIKKYDYLVVGCGLFGATFAQRMKESGKRCLIIEKRNHIAGNAYTERRKEIDVHVYGAHIFHTSDEEVWNYVSRFGPFSDFINSPLAFYKGKLYNLPFNMNTFTKIWNITTPEEAKKIIEEQQKEYGVSSPANLEEQAIKLVGKDIYEILIKGYTQKQWGMDPKELPPSIIKRLPVRFTFDNNYFNDLYQGIPKEGYTQMVEAMIRGIDIELNVDYLEHRGTYDDLADIIVYTGPIDRFFNYQYGELEYRSLRFEHEELATDNYQGNAVINYTDIDIPYTRIIEHRFFSDRKPNNTIITKEYPANYKETNEPYYPINDDKNQTLFRRYQEHAQKYPNIIFGGRLAEYKYYDMHHVIRRALDCVNSIEKNSGLK